MTTFETAVTIAAPPEHAWNVLVDFERWPEWTASMRRLERVTPGPAGRGARVRVEQPELQPAVFTITDWRPGSGFRWVMGGAALGACADHELAPEGGGTRLLLRVKYTGLLAPLVALAYGGLTRRYLAMEAEGLRARAEGRR
ncbi:MAG: SRPBCC family protein [Candidatus Eisenbacteria bacterium]